jgi:hypothetical protein
MGRRSSAPAVLGFDVSGTDGSALLLHKFSTGENAGRGPARVCCSSISKVWVSTIESLVHAAFRWSPAATPADRCAPLAAGQVSLLEE